MSIKRSISEEYIKNALVVSDKVYWNEIKDRLRLIFGVSNYPKRFINNRFFNVERKMNDRRRYVRAKNSKEGSRNGNRVYISFPYKRCILRRSELLVRKLNMKNEVRLSPRIMGGMKQRIFARLKCKLTSRSMINATAKIRCADCKFSCRITTVTYDLKRTVHQLLNNKESSIAKHLMKFPGHSMKDSLREIKTFKNKHDMKCLYKGYL